MTDSTDLVEPLQGKSARLFLAAGALLVIFAANTAARAFADSGVDAVHGFVGPAGFFVGLVGLVGLYPALADRSPRLARLAAAAAVIPLVGWVVIAGVGLGSAVGVLPGVSVVLPAVVFISVFPLTILAYLLFGVTSLRVDVHSRSVGVLLLAPAAVFLTLMVGVQSPAIPATETTEFVIDSGHALAHLAIGTALWTGRSPADHAGVAPESTP